MATYAIGDIQGCFDPFQRLLEKIRFDPGIDRLWLVGDLVNRGPASLQVLRWTYQHRDSITAVLGNHDLHLLARAAGVRGPKSKDTLDGVLRADDRDELIDWLSGLPFFVTQGQHAMVHAGLMPSWTVERAAELAREMGEELQGPNHRRVLAAIYSGTTPDWNDALQPPERWASLAGVFTRLRTCTLDGRARYDFSGTLWQLPMGHVPWFVFPNRRSDTHTVVCGHWAALGLHLEPGISALDSGCVWGGPLTALRLEDAEIIQEKCEKEKPA
jgi:bis(5'-nucleosyl)-tetraphosphatase (symmetrical)